MLSTESQMVLKALLPPTAFHEFQPSLEPNHPSVVDSMMVNQPATGFPSDTLNTSIFTDPHFLAAAHTFQDHIYSNWMSNTHREKVKNFQDGIRDGTLAAAWKDEVWEKNNKSTQPALVESSTSLATAVGSSARAGCVVISAPISRLTTDRCSAAAEVKLVTLAKNGVVRVGDVIAYKRNFSALETVVEKDVIVRLSCFFFRSTSSFQAV
jgi:hypothetical protein